MAVRSHDQGFVEAPPDRVYLLVADPLSYPRWWPGARAADGGVALPLRGTGRMAPDGARDGLGLHLVSSEASLEWYLEPFDDGTIVNAFLEIREGGRGMPRRLLRMRSELRRALVGLHRALRGDGGRT